MPGSAATTLPFGALLGGESSSSAGSGAATAPRSRAKAKPTQKRVEPEPAEESRERAHPFNDFMARVSQGAISRAEADLLRPQLIEAIQATGDTLDDILTETNRMHAESDIWDLDEKDAKTLADALLILGRRAGPGAAAVRAVAEGYSVIRALAILFPRVGLTVTWYPQHGGFGR